MKIYDYKGFPNPLRVRIALEEKGLTDHVDFIHVDVPAGDHKKPEFLAKNPSAAVPVLELNDGTILSESTAITEYLDHSSDSPVLTGTTAKERGVIHMIQRKVEDGLMDAVGAYFHLATPGLGPDIETYQNEDWGHNRRETAIKTMKWMDGILANRKYLAGDTFTVADITAFAGLTFAAFAKIEVPENLTNLKAWHERVSARNSVQKAAA